MAPSFDCGVLSLLCAEENDSIYYDDDADLGVVEEFETTWHHRNSNQKHSFKGEEEESMSGVPLQSDECLSLMLKNEFDHLPAGDYLKRLRNGDLDLGARQEAVDWMRKSHIKRKWVLVGSFVFPVMLIVCMCFYFTFDISPTLLLSEIGFQVHAHFSFGPLCAYLSVNYLDRFHSAYDLPKGKTWMMQLLAVACLSLAAKMEETEVPLCLDLQVCESKFVFEARTIQRMELLVLSTLKWRMQAITPFSFIDCFLAKINGDQISSRLSIFRSTQLILSIIKGIDFLEFRLSEIAASVAMSVAGETQTVDTENTLYELIPHLQKERVIKCVELMNKLSSLSGTTDKGLRRLFPSSVPQSPIGVLDAACLSYRTDDSTVGSRANSSHYNPDTKRRKLNRPFELEL